MVEAFISGLLQVFTIPAFPLMLIGIAVGFAVGILPGLGGPVALALMLPFVFDMKPVEAFAFLLGMISVTATTGDITSVLFGVPGEGTSAATIVDGHPMTKNGEAGRALGAALMSSLVGAVFGAFVLAAAIPIVRPLVLAFGSPEFFALALLGLTFVAALSGENKLKGAVSGGLGLMLAMVGLDPQSGVQRYTFGQLSLWEGLGLVPVTAGLFAIPEIVEMWVKRTSIAEKAPGQLSGVWQGCKDTFIHWGVTLRCSMIGTFIGIVPGLGGAVAQWLAYAHAVQSASDKSRFGHGDVRGVLGPGAANNSKEGGAIIPTIAFGVPGSVSMAILLGAFLIQGLVPGPSMLTTHLSLTFSFVWLIVLSNVITVGVCFLVLKHLVKITYVRGALVIPAILLMVFLGSYADSNSLAAVVVTLLFGFIGLLMVYLDWPRPPLILGLVLGTLIEKNLFISYTRYEFSFLLRPMVVAIFLVGLAIILAPTIRRVVLQRSGSKEGGIVAGRG
ncbi:MAG: tripartite tricarboxylate transporter permease [Chloroflexi bacterium]|nr:tripartite tricarboxylate transporter permease [Chloroflexota bacterium]